jgi:hypothetical protein
MAAKEQQFPCSVVRVGFLVPVHLRPIPCFISAVFAWRLSQGIVKALTIIDFFWSVSPLLAAGSERIP